ncbi:MAG: zf-HC2 domain-containing protein [Solirubrobacterales bacterium]
MICKMDEKLLYSYADETIEELEKIFVEEHLKYCDHCNKKLELIKFTDRELKQLDIGLIPTDRLRVISDLVIENCLAKAEEESTGLKLHNYIQDIRKLQNIGFQSSRIYKNNPYERFLTESINKVSSALITPAKSYVNKKIGYKLLKLMKVG